MEREYSYLLSLLGAFLKEKAPQKDTEVDWRKLIHLAQIHNVSGILGYMAMNYPICPEKELLDHLRKNCLVTMALYAQRAQFAEDYFAILSGHQIRHCPMKGIMLRQLYPVPELRSFSDVDLLIHPQDRSRSHILMQELGFETKADWEPVYSYRRDTEFYEIHTQLVEVDLSDKADYLGYYSRAWEYVRETAPYSCQFTAEFHFVYLITHIAKHVLGSGAGIRMYLDIAAYILANKNMDWTWTLEELKKLKLFDFTRTVLSSVEAWFGIRCPIELEPVPNEVLEEFRSYTLEAGIFGKFQRETGLATLKKESGSRISVLAKRAFPGAKDIQARYTYLQEKPYLLPVAWVHRFFKTDIRFSRHVQEAKTILTADQEKVHKLQKICADIGL